MGSTAGAEWHSVTPVRPHAAEYLRHFYWVDPISDPVEEAYRLTIRINAALTRQHKDRYEILSDRALGVGTSYFYEHKAGAFYFGSDRVYVAWFSEPGIVKMHKIKQPQDALQLSFLRELMTESYNVNSKPFNEACARINATKVALSNGRVADAQTQYDKAMAAYLVGTMILDDPDAKDAMSEVVYLFKRKLRELSRDLSWAKGRDTGQKPVETPAANGS